MGRMMSHLNDLGLDPLDPSPAAASPTNWLLLPFGVFPLNRCALWLIARTPLCINARPNIFRRDELSLFVSKFNFNSAYSGCFSTASHLSQIFFVMSAVEENTTTTTTTTPSPAPPSPAPMVEEPRRGEEEDMGSELATGRSPTPPPTDYGASPVAYEDDNGGEEVSESRKRARSEGVEEGV